MSILKKIVYYFNLYSNIKNVSEYRKNRKHRDERALEFITRPNPIKFSVSASMYPVFKEVFCWDAYQISKLIKRLPTSPTVIDIGANCGFFDVLLLSKRPKSRILAFEPLPVNVAIINATLNANAGMSKQMQLFPEAVTGNKNGQLELHIENSENNSEIASVYADFDERNTRKIVVPCRSLATILNENGMQTIDLLKMDCEGSEFDILYNTPADSLKKIKYISAEVHDLDGEKRNVGSLSAFLQQHGFKVSSSVLSDSCFYLQASLT